MDQPGNDAIAILNSVAVPVIVTDRNGIIIWWNRSSTDYFSGGIEAGIPLFRYLEIDPDICSGDLAALSGESYLQYTEVTVLHYETDRIVDITVSLLNHVNDGLPVFTLKDRTPSFKAQEDLKELKEKLRLLFESLTVGILVTDPDCNIMQVNRAYLKIFGYDERDVLSGKNINKIFDSAGDCIIGELFNLAMKNGCSGVVSYELHSKKILFLELQVMLISGEDNAPRGFLLLADDVTDRRIAEQDLRESEMRNRALVDAIPDIMFRVNNEGVCIDKMIETKVNEVFPHEAAVDAVCYIAEAIRTREIRIYEYPVTISMDERYYEARFVAIDDNEVLIIIRNITEKRKALDAIEHARSETELANRAKAEFLANMSHEIRTPLNSITGFIELLTRTKIDEIQREFLNIVKQSVGNLLGIINDILDFSKIESHKLEISRVEFDPCQEFESVIRLFSIRAREKEINLTSFIDPLLPSGIVSDPLRLKQIMSNLLSNAIKFTPEKGAVVVEIKLFRIRDNICMINFSVSDTGTGIPERKQEKIFEAFTQAEGSVTRHFGGAGLGLSISSSLVKLLGSEIILESRIGVGSKFYFTLEAVVSRDSTMKDSFSASNGIKACVVSYSSDDPVLINLEYYLQSFGFIINFRNNLKKINGDNYDILFVIDSGGVRGDLPGQAENISGVPAVLVSDSSCEEPSVELRQIFSYFLSQPLFPGNVIRTAMNIIGINSRNLTPAGSEEKLKKLKFRGKVLIGEDNRINQKLMMLLLRDYGVEFHIAGNGLDVFDLYKKGGYDLVFMDIDMPVANGFETAKMIIYYENQLALPHTPIIALTAKVLNRDRDMMFESGMDGYISKPVEIERLENVLAQYLEMEAAHKEAEKKSDDEMSADPRMVYDIKCVAAELKIPVNVLESLCREFFEESVDGIIELRKAFEENDFEMMRILSHKMKGAAANLRFFNVAEYFEGIEENSISANKEFAYAGIFDNIEKELLILRSGF